MRTKLLHLVVILALALGLVPVSIPAQAAPPAAVTFTILHTNDFHGQLDSSLSASNPGSARIATIVNGVRTSVGADNVLLVDAGDEMQGSLLSNLGDGTPTGKGMPTIDVYNKMGYNIATFGNHEFDWGQVNLTNRTTEAVYPYVTANIVKNNTGNCATAGWEKPDFADAPYQVLTVGIAPNTVKVAFIGVTTTETPIITVATATAGLCFKDPAESIIHYYDMMKAGGADVIVVLSHLGFSDGGYGYGIPVYGDGTLAAKLNTAGKPVNLIIGGHSHTNMTAATTVGSTTIAQAYYNGRTVGRADVTVSTAGAVSVAWSRTTGFASGAKDPYIDSVVTSWATNPAYLAIVNQPVGYSAVDLGRSNTGDNMMGTFIDDAIYNYLNTDAESANDVDLFFNNAGGIRTDWCWNGTAWASTGCVPGTHAPALLNYGHMYTILPFGNATAVGEMTGAQILEVINYGPNVAGVIQPAGLKYKYFSYKDAKPGPQPYAWGAFDACVVNKTTKVCEPLDMKKTYKVGTNEFLAPAGGDGYNGFKYMKNITYWGDMLNAVNAYVTANYGTAETAYKGPNGDAMLDGRIIRDGTDAGGSIVPITILHHNDPHGRLLDYVSGSTTYPGYTRLATLINQERAHNAARTLLFNAGDTIQGDAMMAYYKAAFTGKGSDGATLPATLTVNPIIAAMNAMNYTAMTLGNHEFNYGNTIFAGTLKQATFPLLQANVTDTGAYGLSQVPIKSDIAVTLPGPAGDVKVAVLGIGNHRVPQYELPSNIPGLTFTNPIAETQNRAPALKAANDAVIALTHIGFTTDPNSVEVDNNVDTILAAQTTGVDAIIGSHSHTNPSTGFGPYKFLPTLVGAPDNTPVIVNQAYRYNNYLGEVVLGLLPKAGGGYQVVSRAGRYILNTTSVPEDTAVKAIVQPYDTFFQTFKNRVVGVTTVPIDTSLAFTQETNGANMQVDASLWKLNQVLSPSVHVDFHLSGAMTNAKIASSATVASPVTMTVNDMFTLMPYENSLVVFQLNGPQLKTVLERAYRNYYYYKYVPGYGGYSYYTTCMVDIDKGGRIYYKDTYDGTDAGKPNGNNVMGLVINGKAVDFTDASKYYTVSTVNYIAAGSCNFNDGGKTIWPLEQIVADTQYYVRDVMIDYIPTLTQPIAPAIEGRLLFGDTTAPVITINSPTAQAYWHPNFLTLDFSAVDGADGTTPSFAAPSGVKSITADLDGQAVKSGDVIDLYTLSLGNHTLTVVAADFYGNSSTQSVTFSVTATVQSLKASVNRFYQEGKIDNADIRNSLLEKLNTAQAYLNKGNIKAAQNTLQAFINSVLAQSGKHITVDAAGLLITDARWVITYPK